MPTCGGTTRVSSSRAKRRVRARGGGVVDQRRRARQVARRQLIGLAGGHEGRRDHPGERQESEEGRQEQRRVDGEREQAPLHRRASRRRRPTCSAEVARMRAKRVKAIAAACPMFHQRKPCWYMRRAIESVALSGPPRVITYGSAKSWKKPTVVMTPAKI